MVCDRDYYYYLWFFIQKEYVNLLWILILQIQLLKILQLILLTRANVNILQQNFQLPNQQFSFKTALFLFKIKPFLANSPFIDDRCKQSFYETKRGAFQKRAPSFGYGSKIQFANREGVPHSGQYGKKSEFDNNLVKKRGYSFGKDQNRSLIQNQEEVRKFPGPGAYVSIDEKFKTGYGSNFQNVSYSMRGKYQDPLQRHGNQLGPGHYQTYGSLSERGHYYSTKYPNSKCQKVGKQTRFQLQKIETPGPGHYQGQHKVNLNGTGTYFHSKFLTTKANSFSRSERPSPAKKNEAPDPGTYFQFSQFALRNKNV